MEHPSLIFLAIIRKKRHGAAASVRDSFETPVKLYAHPRADPTIVRQGGKHPAAPCANT